MVCYRFKGVCALSLILPLFWPRFKGCFRYFTVFTYFGRVTKWYHQVIDSMFAERKRDISQ